MVERVFQPVEAAAAIAGGSIMVVTMVLTSIDAILRYTIDAPLTFNFYLTENYFMVGMLVLPLAWGFRNGGYVRIVALIQVLPRIARDLLLRVGLLVSCVYVAVLTWRAWGYFLSAYRRGDVNMGVVNWPVSWSWAAIPLGLGLLSIRLLLFGLGPARSLQAGSKEGSEDGI